MAGYYFYGLIYFAAVGNKSYAVGGSESTGSLAIYRYNLTSDGYPFNKQLVSLARRAIPDGLYIDGQGRIWTGEYEEVVVRSPDGKVFSVFNTEYTKNKD